MSGLRDAVTLEHQCWPFAVGSTFFAVATVPGVPTSATLANVLCFVGSWFFTCAAWIQLVRSSPEGTVEWYSAATQFGGTVLFNVSTGAAVWARAVLPERGLVWAPDATGSVAFLVSGVLAVVVVNAGVGRWAPECVEWQSGWINMAGCVAFAVSAVSAFVTAAGAAVDPAVAAAGTFVGALCFLVAALLPLTATRRL